MIIFIFFYIATPLLFNFVSRCLILLNDLNIQVEWKTGTYITTGYPTKLVAKYEMFQTSYTKITLTPIEGIKDGYVLECVTSSIFNKDIQAWNVFIKYQHGVSNNRFTRVYLQIVEIQGSYMYDILGCDPEIKHDECPILFHGSEQKSQYSKPSKFIYLNEYCNLITEHGTFLMPWSSVQYS